MRTNQKSWTAAKSRQSKVQLAPFPKPRTLAAQSPRILRLLGMSVPLMLLLAFALLSLVAGMPPVSVVASVRGKKYDVTAETVEEFTSKVEEAAGLEAGQQSVLFRGKVLKASDRLDELGVSAGDVLNVVKGRKTRPAGADAAVDGVSSGTAGDAATKSLGGGGGGAGGGMPSLADLQSMSADAMKNPEEMQKAMQAMDQLLDSDFVDEYFSDDEKLEKARLDMLAKLDQYDQMMPGFKAQAQEIASNPQKWREAMGQAKQQITSMKAQRDAMRGATGGTGAAGAAAAAAAAAAAKTQGIADSGVDDVPEDSDE